MAWVAVDKDGQEWIYEAKPQRCHQYERWQPTNGNGWVFLPKGSIEKVIGKKLTWEDEPIELKEED